MKTMTVHTAWVWADRQKGDDWPAFRAPDGMLTRVTSLQADFDLGKEDEEPPAELVRLQIIGDHIRPVGRGARPPSRVPDEFLSLVDQLREHAWDGYEARTS
jgi:hypothetical protein